MTRKKGNVQFANRES
jgi:hypothetical protein